MNSIAAEFQLQADLKCEYEGHAFSVKGANDTIVVEVSNLKTGIRLIRELSRQKDLRFDLGQLRDWLDLIHSTLEFRVNGICVATAGGGNHSCLGRLLSFKGVRLLPLAALRTVLSGRL